MQTYKKRNVDVRVVSMIDMSTFLENLFCARFPNRIESLANGFFQAIIVELLISASHDVALRKIG